MQKAAAQQDASLCQGTMFCAALRGRKEKGEFSIGTLVTKSFPHVRAKSGTARRKKVCPDKKLVLKKTLGSRCWTGLCQNVLAGQGRDRAGLGREAGGWGDMRNLT